MAALLRRKRPQNQNVSPRLQAPIKDLVRHSPLPQHAPIWHVRGLRPHSLLGNVSATPGITPSGAWATPPPLALPAAELPRRCAPTFSVASRGPAPLPRFSFPRAAE